MSVNESGKMQASPLSIMAILNSEEVRFVAHGFQLSRKGVFEKLVGPDYRWRVFFDTEVDYGPGKGTLSTGIYVPSLIGIESPWCSKNMACLGVMFCRLRAGGLRSQIRCMT